MHSIPSFSNIFCIGVSSVSTTTRFSSSISTFIDSHFDDIQRGWLSEMVGWGARATFQPALWNMSSWLHGRSGLAITSPGPMMLKVASMCIGLGSLNDMVWTLYWSPRWRLIHSIPMRLDRLRLKIPEDCRLYNYWIVNGINSQNNQQKCN